MNQGKWAGPGKPDMAKGPDLGILGVFFHRALISDRTLPPVGCRSVSAMSIVFRRSSIGIVLTLALAESGPRI